MMKTIYFIDGFYGCLTFIAVDATRIVEEQHRRAFRSALNSLVYRRQEATRPHTLSSIRISPARRKHDKSGKITILATQSIRHPGAHAWTAQPRAARVQ